MKAYAKLILSMVIWGSLALVVRPVALPSAQIVVYRIAFGFLFLFAVAWISKLKVDRAAMRKSLLRLLLSGAAMGGNWVALFEAYRFVDVSVATLAYYCAPMLVIAVSAFVYREHLNWQKLFCIAASVTGVLLVTGAAMGGIDPVRGIVCGLISASLYACVTLINKSVLGVGPIESTLVQLVGACAVTLPYALLTGGVRWQMPSPLQWVCLVTLGFVHTGLALYLYFSAVRTLPAQTAALCSYIDPVCALVFAAIFLGEHMSAIQLIGACLIVGGAALGSIIGARKASVSPDA